jgi:hypothetical protein
VFELKLSNEFPFDDTNFLKEYVSEYDIRFLKSLLIDDPTFWQLLDTKTYKNQKMNLFYSPKVNSFFKNTTVLKNASIIKQTVIGNFPFEKWIVSLLPYTKGKSLKYLFKHEGEELNEMYPEDKELINNRWSIGLNLDVNIGKLFNTRKLYGTKTFEYDEKNKMFYHYLKPCIINLFIKSWK